MAGETGGGDREGPSPPGPINFISWVGPGGPIYNENGPFLLLLNCFSAIAIVVYIVGFGPFETLVDPFPRRPQGLVTPPPPPPPPRFVGRGRRAENKRSIPLES